MSSESEKKEKALAVSQGVEELVEKLRAKGVEAGRAEGNSIIAEAKKEAAQILDAARAKATELVQEAQESAEEQKQAAQDACEVAARDTILNLRTQLSDRLHEDVRNMVAHEMKDPEMLKKLILIVAGRATENLELDQEEAEILLPRSVLGLDEIHEDPSLLEDDLLTDLLVGLNKEMLHEGVVLKPGTELQGGLSVKLVQQNVEVNLSDEVVAELLLAHLQPRFRALLEGVLKKDHDG